MRPSPSFADHVTDKHAISATTIYVGADYHLDELPVP